MLHLVFGKLDGIARFMSYCADISMIACAAVIVIMLVVRFFYNVRHRDFFVKSPDFKDTDMGIAFDAAYLTCLVMSIIFEVVAISITLYEGF